MSQSATSYARRPLGTCREHRSRFVPTIEAVTTPGQINTPTRAIVERALKACGIDWQIEAVSFGVMRRRGSDQAPRRGRYLPSLWVKTRSRGIFLELTEQPKLDGKRLEDIRWITAHYPVVVIVVTPEVTEQIARNPHHLSRLIARAEQPLLGRGHSTITTQIEVAAGITHTRRTRQPVATSYTGFTAGSGRRSSPGGLTALEASRLAWRAGN